jgi:putative ABC transport system permease protein
METILQDLSYSLRTLLKSRSFAAVAIFTLALGIGANTAIFSVVYAVLRPLSYRDSEQLIVVNATNVKRGLPQVGVSYPDYIDWKSQSRAFAQMAAMRNGSFNLTGAGEPERLSGVFVTAGLFPLLGVDPELGRTFVAEDDNPGGSNSVIISHQLWQRRFSSDPAVINKAVTLEGESFNIIGVMRPNFRFPPGDEVNRDVWLPLSLYPEKQLKNRARHFLTVVGRLKPEATQAQAQAEMNTIATRLEQEYPETNSGYGVRLVSFYEDTVGNVRKSLYVLLGAVGLVLLIACGNVANLLLARSAAREREIAIRTALGASRARLIRQLLTESLLLSLIGGALGLLLAYGGTRLLIANTPPASIPRLEEIGMDWRVLLFSLLISVLTGLIFGLMPSLHAAKVDLTTSLKEGGRGATEGVRGRSFRNVLMIAEVSLALLLLIGSGLLIKSFVRLRQVDVGFQSDKLLTANVALSEVKYESPTQRAAFFRQLLQRLETVPGVQYVGAASDVPLLGRDSYENVFIEGRPVQNSADAPQAGGQVVSPNYFRAMGVPLRKGRTLTDEDVAGKPMAVVINQTMANRFWPGEDPLNKHVSAAGPTGPWMTVVGVVGDVRYRGLNTEPRAEMYVSYQQLPVDSMTLALRTTSEPTALGTALRNEVWALDKDQPVTAIKTMGQAVSDSIARERFNMQLLTIFALVALLLASVGVYGVISYYVVQRTHEIGILLALGAQPFYVLKLVVKQGMTLALLGVGIGLVGAFILTRIAASLLFGVSPTDPITFFGVSFLLAFVAFLSCYIPARRAARVDPMKALHHE